MADSARDVLQRQAEGYVRQGRLDAAIDAYEQVARATPTDWNLIKQIADLQERAGRREAAASRFLQCADHSFDDGFLARAAALYRKVLKLDGKSEHALDKLAEVSLALKLKMDARHALSQLAILRRDRGDEEGARQVAARLSALDGGGLTLPQEVSEVWRPVPMAQVPDPVPDPTPEAEPLPESWPPPPAAEEAGLVGAPADGHAPPHSPEDLRWEITLADVPVGSAPDTEFDWGALLGRDVGPSTPVVEPAPIAPANDVANEARSVVDLQDDLEAEEIDLTDLLDQLAVTPPAGTSPAELWLDESPKVTREDVAAAGPNAEAGEEGDARALAARHLAAGRVFAAAGLVAEAARAFERASRDLRTRFEAAEALAGLHRSRGQMAEAIRWYDEAARAPVADEAVRRPVLYDLAEALEAAGQPGRALAVLLDLLSEVEDYRDARARADRLLRVDAGG